MEEQTTPQMTFSRDEDFASLYANNVQFETSVWDLKLIFGQLNQAKGTSVVEQHTAMSVSWLEAKLLAYFLTVNLVLHQTQNGEVKVPASVIPPRPDASNPELDDTVKNMLVYLAWIHDQFFGADPYIPPGVDGKKL
jgi:hypothetical protein